MGYDLKRFVDKKLADSDLICIICSGILQDPVQFLNCEHVFCHDCIKEWINRQGNCPIDRSPITLAEIKPAPRILKNLINRLEVTCDNSAYGCHAIIDLDSKAFHLKACEFDPNKTIKCVKGCGLMITRKEANGHNCVENLTKLVINQHNENEKLTKLVKDLLEKSTNQEMILKTNSTEITNLHEKLQNVSKVVKTLKDKVAKQESNNQISLIKDQHVKIQDLTKMVKTISDKMDKQKTNAELMKINDNQQEKIDELTEIVKTINKKLGNHEVTQIKYDDQDKRIDELTEMMKSMKYDSAKSPNDSGILDEHQKKINELSKIIKNIKNKQESNDKMLTSTNDQNKKIQELNKFTKNLNDKVCRMEIKNDILSKFKGSFHRKARYRIDRDPTSPEIIFILINLAVVLGLIYFAYQWYSSTANPSLIYDESSDTLEICHW